MSRDSSHPRRVRVRIGSIEAGQGLPLVVIAGPCVIESREHALRHARKLKRISRDTGVPLIFKSSYDKANRTSGHAYRGPGIDAGLEILRQIREITGLPVLTDVHTQEEVDKASRVVDVLQIPAFLCRQTDLVKEASRTGLPVNIKKGQFVSPQEMRHVVEKALRPGFDQVMLTERGFTFGYNNLVSDFRSLVVMREWGFPIVYDATHSVQEPGGRDGASGGQRRFVAPLARAACVVGADVVFMEVHENPDRAPSDGPNMVFLKDVPRLWRELKELTRWRLKHNHAA